MPLGAGFPFLDRTFGRVEMARKDRSADPIGLAGLLDLCGFDFGRHGKAAFVKATHRRFVDGTDFEHR